MKGKHLAILLLLVALAGGAGYFLYKDNAATWNAGGTAAGAKILDFPINDVAQVAIKSTAGELHLVRAADGWTVRERADYPAVGEQVVGLIRKLWELKTVQEVKVGPSQMARLELAEPGKEGAGTVVTLQDKDGKKLAALLVGKSHLRKGGGGGMGMFGENDGFPAGRYVAPLGSTRVSLVSDTLESVAVKPETWLQRDFFRIENLKTVKLEGATPAHHWTLTRESATGDWKLADAKAEENLDAAKAGSVASLFANASFADVLAPDAKPEDTGLDKPATVTFETFDKFTYVLKIGKPIGENQPVLIAVTADLPAQREPGKDEKPEDKTKLDQEFQTTRKRLEGKLTAEKKFGARPYLMAKTTLDQLLQDRTALLAEKKPEPAAGTPKTPVSATTPPISLPPAPENAPQ
ncbi:MAG: DUF4340 domain-containing protein [Chthoniobacter sp.]|nr:DUF4340 domain-containing protein [Chthoniobacter sp.]